MRTLASRPRSVAAGLALSVALTVAAPPAFAAPPALAAPAQRPTTLAASAEARLAQADTAVALQAPAPAPAEAAGKPFFKTPKGVAAIVLLAAGLTMTFVSYSKDRVKSPAAN